MAALPDKTWCEWLADKIPSGDGCKGCEYWAQRGSTCMLFGEPCDGMKNIWCKRNRWLEGVRLDKRNEEDKGKDEK